MLFIWIGRSLGLTVVVVVMAWRQVVGVTPHKLNSRMERCVAEAWVDGGRWVVRGVDIDKNVNYVWKTVRIWFNQCWNAWKPQSGCDKKSMQSLFPHWKNALLPVPCTRACHGSLSRSNFFIQEYGEVGVMDDPLQRACSVFLLSSSSSRDNSKQPNFHYFKWIAWL